MFSQGPCNLPSETASINPVLRLYEFEPLLAINQSLPWFDIFISQYLKTVATPREMYNNAETSFLIREWLFSWWTGFIIIGLKVSVTQVTLVYQPNFDHPGYLIAQSNASFIIQITFTYLWTIGARNDGWEPEPS